MTIYLHYFRDNNFHEASFDNLQDAVTFLSANDDIHGIYMYTLVEGFPVQIAVKGII